ncbi:MAG TPA: helix-turn-helix domain-containing protein [Anaeromyxobacter sp.]
MRLPFIPAGMDVTVWPPVLATRGPGFRGALHSHHALHFVLALDGELRVRTSAFGPWSSAAGVLTAPDAPHAIDSHGGEVLLVFLDPESDDGATFRPVLDHPVRLLSARERSALVRDVVPRTILRSGADAWVRNAARTMRVALPASPRTIHPRVRRVLRMLRSSGVDDDTSLEVLAGFVGLSPSRLMHVFTASVGIPLRPYLSWLRVQRAAIAIVTGSPLGDAAHAAGFADAAHMSRTFKRMLGVAPSLLRPMRCSEEAALPYR